MAKSKKHNPSSNVPEEFNLAQFISPYLKQWKWFILSCFVFIGLAYFYLRYATPEYEAVAKIILVDDRNSSVHF